MCNNFVAVSILTFAMTVVPILGQADYFVSRQIVELSPDYSSCTLDDGTTWSIHALSAPNVKSFWQTGQYVWVHPILQGSFSNIGMYAILMDIMLCPATCQLQSCNTTLTIQAINVSDGILTLNDNTKWQLDQSFKKYFSSWQANDPVTIAGKLHEKYIINCSDRMQNAELVQGYSLVSQLKITRNNK